MTDTIPATINDRWKLQLLPHREAFHRERPEWEAPRLAHMHDHVHAGETVVDVGAEEGDFSALYRQWVGDEGTVALVEPQPAYWPAIRQTWEANGYGAPPLWFGGFASDITMVEPVAPGVSRFMDARDDGWPRCSIGPVVPDFGFRHLAQQADSTPQTRLDEWCDEHLDAPPDVIVMDIEGAELRALGGCAGLLESQAVRAFYVSQHPTTLFEWYGATSLDILRLMEGYGYMPTFLGFGSEEFWVYER